VENPQTWRELLGRLIKDPQEKQRIANELGISLLTISRWVSGESNPRPHNLRLLLQALPRYRKEFLALIPLEFGDALNDILEVDIGSLEISSAFYARVLQASCHLPDVLRFTSICDMILQQALKHLDPNRVGMELTVVECMPPSSTGMIRSLREILGRGTPPWRRELEQRMFLLGAESLAGYAIATGRSRVVQDRFSEEHLYPVRWMAGEESAMACPIMRADRVAGCLLVSCTQTNYFLPERQDLLQNYAELLSVVFEPRQFYPLSCIALGRLPLYETQRPHFASFRLRMSDLMQKQHMNVPDAEYQAWQQIEEVLLNL